MADRQEYRQVVLRVLNAAYIFQYRVDGERLVMLRVFHGREHRG
jgi:plasmid stabilization system protein ParE